MARMHDLGGTEGFGPVVLDPRDAPPFSSVWEMRTFALMRILMRAGLFSLDEVRDTMERMEPAAYLQAPYYERWLYALEALVVEKGVLRAEELEE